MTATYTIWTKLMRKSLTRADEMIGMLIQPVLWLLLFGIGMRGFLGDSGPLSGDAYLTRILPGVIALTGMAGAIGGGFGWLNERTSGIAREYIAAPISRLSVLSAHTAAIVAKVLFQTLVILVIGILIGAAWSAGAADTLFGALLLVAFIVGFSGIGLAVASMTDDAMGYHLLLSVFNLPLFFLSDALYPLSSMPGWMRVASKANPLTYLINALRATWFGSRDESIALWISTIVLVGFAVLGMLFALWAFLRSIRR